MELDLGEKKLEDYNDVFQDIVNVLLFNGERIIHEDDLVELDRISQYKTDGIKLHEEERDILKGWKNGRIRIASIGIENMNSYYKFMPVRIIGYDGANYREQLLDKNVKGIFPVVSLVLNFSGRRWKKNRTLHECMDIPERLYPYVNDYKIHVFDIAFLTDEQLEMFQSDFKIVAKYFIDRRKYGNPGFPKDIPKHVDEVLKLLTSMTGDPRFIEGWNSYLEKEGRKDGIKMEKWIDEIEERGIAIGEERGEQRGEIKGKIMAYFDLGLSIEQIAKKVEVTTEYVKQVLEPVLTDSLSASR